MTVRVAAIVFGGVFALFTTRAAPFIQPLAPEALAVCEGGITVSVESPPTDITGLSLVVFRGDEPLGRLNAQNVRDGRLIFPRPSEPVDGDFDRLRAWLVQPELVAHLRPRWPGSAVFSAVLDAVGPGRENIWIRAGRMHGVRMDDTWWVRVHGQPAARFEVLWIGPFESWCRVVPLTVDWSPGAGTSAALWPTPGERMRGEAASAVCYVEASDEQQVVWVAAIPQSDLPPDARVEFTRDGRYVTSGVVEREDDRFWYVRTSKQPTPTPVSVGDEARARARRDIAARRFVARVLRVEDRNVWIDAGEVEGLSPGDRCWVELPEGRRLELQIEQVRSTYASVIAGDTADLDTASALEPGAAVRFAEPAPGAILVGVVEQAGAGGVFRARAQNCVDAIVDEMSSGADRSPLLLRGRGGDRVTFPLAMENGAILGFVVWDTNGAEIDAGTPLLMERPSVHRDRGL